MQCLVLCVTHTSLLIRVVSVCLRQLLSVCDGVTGLSLVVSLNRLTLAEHILLLRKWAHISLTHTHTHKIAYTRSPL